LIIEFEDTCWTTSNAQWTQSLVELLAMLARRQQHALLANPSPMLTWCAANLPSHASYFATRLASAVARQNATALCISPSGNTKIINDPIWKLTANAAFDVINQPLRVVLENNDSDKMFLDATLPKFKLWCDEGYISADMGGGSAMGSNIEATCADFLRKWRTFYLFDSDRLHPLELVPGWKPPKRDGCQGFVFQTKCSHMPPGRWHMLSRRSIENYLPESVLLHRNLATTTELFKPAIGVMLNHYNFKNGLQGDGIHPFNPDQRVRTSRSNGFWTSLTPIAMDNLQKGFGNDVAKEFMNVPASYSWSPAINNELDILSDAIQDAM